MANLNLKQIMPLFNPSYSPPYLSNSTQLLTALRNKQFTAEINKLAEQMLSQDSSDYNAWYVKKMYFLNNSDKKDLLQEEINFSQEILQIKSKGFQIWEQRRFLTQNGADPDSQLAKVEQILTIGKDQKNYHAWSYRVWLANRTKKYLSQLQFTQKMIKKDYFNNSAWAHRFFILESLLGQIKNQEERKKILDSQIKFILESLKLYKYNRASWNYLRGLFPSIQLKNFSSQNSIKPPILQSFDQYPEILLACTQWWNEAKNNEKSEQKELAILIQRQVLATLVQIYSHKEQHHEFAVNSCAELIVKEAQRKNYWGWVNLNL